MENINSKSEDVMWLAYQLKNKLGKYVSFNMFGIDNPILTGVFCRNGNTAPYYKREDVRFYIKFCKNEFLRVQIHEGCNEQKDIINAMESIIDALSTIAVDENPIGNPLAIYKVDNSLTSEYAFKNVEEVALALQNGTIFDDGVISDLRFTNKEYQPIKDSKIKSLNKKASII